MSDQWKTDLERLCECYDTYAALGQALGVSRHMVQKVHTGAEEPSGNFKQRLGDHRRKIQNEHVAGQEMKAMVQQVIPSIRQRMEEDALTGDYLDRIQRRLDKKEQQLCD